MNRDWRRLPWEMRYVHAARTASRLRQLAIAATHRHASVTFGKPVFLGPGFHLSMPGPGRLVVGDGVELRRNVIIEVVGEGRVTIGDGAVLTYGPVIQCTTSIEIGAGAVIAQQVTVVDGNHRFRDPALHVLAQGYDYRPVRIGAGALILSKATVIADVGEGAVVGANSVVTEPVPPYSLAVGAPARVVERFAGGG